MIDNLVFAIIIDSTTSDNFLTSPLNIEHVTNFFGGNHVSNEQQTTKNIKCTVENIIKL